MTTYHTYFHRNLLCRLAIIGILAFLAGCGAAPDTSPDLGSTGDTGGTGGSGSTDGTGGGTVGSGSTGGTESAGGSTLTLEISIPAPGNYEWDTISLNKYVYIDRNYTYSAIPANYLDIQYLRTANDDKASTSNSFLNFTINKTADILIGHANNDNVRPAWLSSWTSTGEVLETTDRTLYLYKKTFASGVVTLPGNAAGNSMYVVLVDDGSVSGGTTQENIAPVISGNPSTSITAGKVYSFIPNSTDANSDILTYTITNRPAWTNFNTTNGQLSGTPTAGDEAVYNNILITVSDGAVTVSLPEFSINVLPVASGTVTLSWTPPTTNADGSTLEDLAGYKIYYGTTIGNYPNVITLGNASLSTYIVENLAPDEYFFVITSLDDAGNESVYSNMATKTVM